MLLCSGKVYYDLAAWRAEHEVRDTAILRLEQLHPFPADSLREALAAYPSAEVRWVQEEPENMGAWTYVALRLPALLDGRPPLTVRARAGVGQPGRRVEQGARGSSSGRVVEAAFAD